MDLTSLWWRAFPPFEVRASRGILEQFCRQNDVPDWVEQELRIEICRPYPILKATRIDNRNLVDYVLDRVREACEDRLVSGRNHTYRAHLSLRGEFFLRGWSKACGMLVERRVVTAEEMQQYRDVVSRRIRECG